MENEYKIFENDVTADDLADINSLLRQLSDSIEPKEFGDIQKVMENSMLFSIRDLSGKILGMSTLTKLWKPSGYFGTIEEIVVDENLRGKGLGKKLMEEMIKRGRKLGMKQIELTSKPSRLAANQLYKSLDFELRETNVYRLKLI